MLARNVNTFVNASKNVAFKRSFSVVSQVQLDQAGKNVSVLFENGSNAEFSSVWLRDHCPSTLHPTSLQRQLDSAEIDSDITVSNVEIGSDGSTLNLKFNDGGADSVYQSQWLYTNSYATDMVNSRVKNAPVSRKLWNASSMAKEDIPSYSSEQIMDLANNGPIVKDMLQNLAIYGAVIVKNMPTDIAETEAIVRAGFGPPRETFYGAMWDTAPKNEQEINDTAYTKDALHVHTDTSYLIDSPGLQLFNCVAQSEPTEGGDIKTEGATRLLDGFNVIEILKQDYPETYDFFLNTYIKWHCIEEGTNVSAVTKAIILDPLTGDVRQYRYNTYDLAPLNYMDPQTLQQFYYHNKIMCDVMRSPENVAQVRMECGEMVVIDNHRVCHGRNAFQGYRNMVGCYVGRDDWESKLRVHGGVVPTDV